ncbi:MAG: PQQ-dependent sugar dehydrogenase, partial [Acidimicrobiia bacterium]|nr:PQQ-dependent sugar dehydrogenase [Acidimicrobiia bacterium]
MPPTTLRRSRRATRRRAVPAALLAASLAAAACAAPPMSPSGSRSQSQSGAGSSPQPAVQAQPERDSGQNTADGQSGGQSGGDGRGEPPPAGQDGAGEDPGGEVTGAATGVGSCGKVEEGARSDGGGTPPTGSGAAASNAGAADAAGDPAPAPPITPPGSRFPEPLGVSLTRLAELPVPLAVAFRAQEPGALYVALRHGEVVRLRGDSGRVDSSAMPSRDAEAVLDMSARVDTRGEMGLLGLTFSPAGDRLYTSSVNRRQVSELWEWPVAADGRVDSGGSRLVLSLEQPFSNHNGGDVTFGPDGYLYLGFGDGGGGGDPLRAGQDPHDWLGTILRIDPRPGPGGEPYTVPAGNPFAGGAAGAPEVWVWGARNPWRFSFDRITGDLWVSDVGQDLLEEINR